LADAQALFDREKNDFQIQKSKMELERKELDESKRIVEERTRDLDHRESLVTNLEQEKDRIIKRENAVNERVQWVVKETARIAYELEESKKEREFERERIKALEEKAEYEMKVGRELAAKSQSELDRMTEDRIQLDNDRQEASKITIELATESVQLQCKFEEVESKKLN